MLLTPEQFFGFLAAALLITVSPGPDNLMVLGVGISRGRKQGMAFGLGCALGCLSHTLLAALGISALIAASPIAFSALKIAGGLYLIYLGVQALRSSGLSTPTKLGATSMSEETLLKLFSKGLIANSINPKVVLFFLSFLPQFVLQKNGHIGWQTAQLGLIFTAQGVLLFSLLGYFSGAVGQWLNQRPKAGLWLDRVAGSIFIALGLRLVFTR
ncbi:LysE family translocator [Solimicrobium silvestre]|uniref:Putative threonine efflux protein n=1 Tax=Solimicrobium silvestre TaxID=2099400 RepID=A0A2S9H4I0_9BURK|nr:LysE family translocator [Solimicrobium silvestre]PRC94895.1 putative threonine efflux protein [Solimicrobium silvestre]